MLAFWPSLKFASPPLHIFQLVSSEAQVDFSRSVVPNQAFELLAPDTSSYSLPSPRSSAAHLSREVPLLTLLRDSTQHSESAVSLVCESLPCCGGLGLSRSSPDPSSSLSPPHPDLPASPAS